MKHTPLTLAALAGLLALAVTPASAVVISDDFSGYTANPGINLSNNPGGGGPWLGNATTGFGPTGAGWLIGWRNASDNANGSTSGYVLNANPPVTGGGNYFSYTVNTAAGNTVAASSLARAYNATEVSAGGTAAFSTSFDFRADSVTGGPVRFNLSNSNSRTANYDSTATWVLSAYDGYWHVGDGPGNNFVSTGMALTVGVTYSITVHENPVTKEWSVSIFNGATSVSLTELAYRTANWTTGGGSITDARWLTFSASEVISGASIGASATFSVDNIVISSIPEPSALALLLGTGVLGAALVRRRR